MSFAKAVAALEARQEARIELGLDRVRRHLRRLGDPHRGLPCLHIAGTNGKGSTAAILESALRAAGFKTGLYTSPHLSEVRERIQINARPIPRADFARLMGRALNADPEKKLTYFELLTSVAFQFFQQKKVEVAVLETGLGGRLDATNVVERPLATIIASIHFDHTNYLGATLEQIAAEKAGIIKPGCPVFCPRLPAAALKVIAARAARLKAPLTVARLPTRCLKVDWKKGRQTLSGPRGERWNLGLLGDKQGANAALARAALDGLYGILPVEKRAWKAGLAAVSWPARFEPLRVGGKTALLDGAHNVEAMGALARTWAKSPWSSGATRWILGFMADKDAHGMLSLLAPYLKDVVAVRPPSPRAMDPLALAGLVRRSAPRAHVSVERDLETALRAWRGRGAPRVAVICGSFYLAGRARKLLTRVSHD